MKIHSTWLIFIIIFYSAVYILLLTYKSFQLIVSLACLIVHSPYNLLFTKYQSILCFYFSKKGFVTLRKLFSLNMTG